MNAKLTWLSHGTWLIEHDQHRVLLDPFFTGNPAATVGPDAFARIDHILVSHGHGDHVGDTVAIAKASGAPVIAMVEVAHWLQKQGVAEVIEMNLGGTLRLPWGGVKMVRAEHSSSMPDGTYGGTAAGFVLTIASRRIYFACDTALFGDMQWIGRAGIDVAVLPIGDHYTMGIDDSIEAIRLLGAPQVIPAHYNTWPLIAQDAHAWAQRVAQETQSQAIVLGVGESWELN